MYRIIHIICLIATVMMIEKKLKKYRNHIDSDADLAVSCLSVTDLLINSYGDVCLILQYNFSCWQTHLPFGDTVAKAVKNFKSAKTNFKEFFSRMYIQLSDLIIKSKIDDPRMAEITENLGQIKKRITSHFMPMINDPNVSADMFYTRLCVAFSLNHYNFKERRQRLPWTSAQWFTEYEMMMSNEKTKLEVTRCTNDTIRSAEAGPSGNRNVVTGYDRDVRIRPRQHQQQKAYSKHHRIGPNGKRIYMTKSGTDLACHECGGNHYVRDCPHKAPPPKRGRTNSWKSGYRNRGRRNGNRNSNSRSRYPKYAPQHPPQSYPPFQYPPQQYPPNYQPQYVHPQYAPPQQYAPIPMNQQTQQQRESGPGDHYYKWINNELVVKHKEKGAAICRHFENGRCHHMHAPQRCTYLHMCRACNSPQHNSRNCPSGNNKLFNQ